MTDTSILDRANAIQLVIDAPFDSGEGHSDHFAWMSDSQGDSSSGTELSGLVWGGDVSGALDPDLWEDLTGSADEFFWADEGMKEMARVDVPGTILVS
jgi:hypothetical protein